MNRFGEPLPIGRVRTGVTRFRLWTLPAVALATILFQVYVPLFFQFLSNLHLPLLATVYFAVMRRKPVMGIFIGAGIGLLQDSLSHQPLGMYGIAKTLVGFSAASVSVRFDVDRAVVRLGISFVLFLFHQLCFWVLQTVLLGQQVAVQFQHMLALGLLNALVAVPFFHMLDKLRVEE